MPAKKNLPEHVAAQRKFLNDELEPKLAEARAGQRQLYFGDAMHAVLGSYFGMVWSAVAIFLKAAAGRQRYSVLGAWNAATNTLVHVTTTATVNAALMLELLAALAAAAVPDPAGPAGAKLPITLTLDNAKYQRCAAVEARARELGIELLFLPGYSPNLNLIERLWKFVKKTALRGSYHADFASFQAAIDDCLSKIPTKHAAALKTLITHKFQTFDNVSFLAA